MVDKGVCEQVGEQADDKSDEDSHVERLSGCVEQVFGTGVVSDMVGLVTWQVWWRWERRFGKADDKSDQDSHVEWLSGRVERVFGTGVVGDVAGLVALGAQVW